ncbi:hypothetical protein EV363DRAFT_1401743 [Boletus edulis]|nr:hypothetical protein EV363DRAFT_1401743 [Boletus edulis]
MLVPHLNPRVPSPLVIAHPPCHLLSRLRPRPHLCPAVLTPSLLCHCLHLCAPAVVLALLLPQNHGLPSSSCHRAITVVLVTLHHCALAVSLANPLRSTGAWCANNRCAGYGSNDMIRQGQEA